MHGRHDFRFTPEERKNLREYLENGGTLLADSICASKEFADAFRREMQLVLPEPYAGPHPDRPPALHRRRRRLQHPPSQPPRTRRRRRLASRSARAMQKVPPELEGIEIDGRLAVIFSPYDISCALEQHEAIDCRGYTRQDAARIGLNVLMYTLAPEVAPQRAANR